MVEVTYQMVLSTLLTVSIMVGIFYYLATLRNTQKTRELALESQELTRKAQEEQHETRQIQLSWQALERVYDKEFMTRTIEILYHQDYKDYEEWMEKYGPRTNIDAYVNYYQVTSTYQGLGYLVQQKVLDIESVSNYIRPRSVIFLWEKIEPIVKVHRERLNPNAYDSLEYLANELSLLLKEKWNKLGKQLE
jgi:hypothetical protein